MIITKYNRGNGKYTIGSAASIAANSSSSSSTTNSSSSADCMVWGNYFDGVRDLEDNIFLKGSVYAIPEKYDGFDEEDDDNEVYVEKEFEPYEDDNGGNIYASGKVEANSTYGKSVFLNYPTVTGDKTNILDLFKQYDDAKFWGQGLKSNNYNIIGNMKDVGDINFSGTSKVIGSMSNSSLRPNSLYLNNSVVICPFNGNPWERATNIKNIGAATFISNTNIQLNSVIDYYSDGKYFNNPRINWYIYNPTSLAQEGHWWLGPTWTNDDTTRFGYDAVGAHKNLSLYPSFEVPDDMKNEDGNPNKEYFEQFEFSVGAKIKSHAFIKHNGTDKQFLMADGSTKELKDLGVATSDEIPTVPTKVSQLENDVPYAEYDAECPVILFSGIIHSNNNNGSLTYQPWVVRPLCYSQHTGVSGLTLRYLKIDGVEKCTLDIEVNAKTGWSIKPTSIHSQVSLDVYCNPAADFGGNRRSQGYWMTGGVRPDNKIYLQAWRTDDDNNDSTCNDQIAHSVQEINLTIFGIAKKV
ncbi:MAG: hypothetical protein J1E16_06615 [Muribaculaceae bacterium]|nr:hypothetical protein [Muribaculaceae bacterium]